MWAAATRQRIAMRARISMQTQHPLIQSAEKGEDWRWCYIDDMYVALGQLHFDLLRLGVEFRQF
jgi:hypothetical protein